jgi:hypothetical protein
MSNSRAAINRLLTSAAPVPSTRSNNREELIALRLTIVDLEPLIRYEQNYDIALSGRSVFHD